MNTRLRYHDLTEPLADEAFPFEQETPPWREAPIQHCATRHDLLLITPQPELTYEWP
jgi:hypothetical protein